MILQESNTMSNEGVINDKKRNETNPNHHSESTRWVFSFSSNMQITWQLNAQWGRYFFVTWLFHKRERAQRVTEGIDFGAVPKLHRLREQPCCSCTRATFIDHSVWHSFTSLTDSISFTVAFFAFPVSWPKWIKSEETFSAGRRGIAQFNHSASVWNELFRSALKRNPKAFLLVFLQNYNHKRILNIRWQHSDPCRQESARILLNPSQFLWGISNLESNL